MDLKESKSFEGVRHPWETARLGTIKSILSSVQIKSEKTLILDVGSGDGFVGRGLFSQMPNTFVDSLDTFLQDEQIKVLNAPDDSFTFYNSYEDLPGRAYDIVLMLDVLEHVENDVGLLSSISESSMQKGGWAIVTVPAFQSLFSAHDRFLNHFRRYSLPQLRTLSSEAGLEVVEGGYLFSSLLIPRYLSLLFQKLPGVSEPKPTGVGSWKGGRLLTSLIVLILNAENALVIRLARWGLVVPGLTAWVLCKKSH